MCKITTSLMIREGEGEDGGSTSRLNTRMWNDDGGIGI